VHYYPHHIGDFIADTARLSDSQCMAYLRLIWRYYDTEKPLDNDPESLAFTIGASVQDVNLILKHYFILDGDVWRKTRCDAVISEYHGKADKARKSAEARWNNAKAKQSKSEGNANASSDNANEPEIDANQKPKTNNQKQHKESGCPYQSIVDLYHEILPMCPEVRLLTKTRKAYLKARWESDKNRQTLEYWRNFFEYVSGSQFLTGKG